MLLVEPLGLQQPGEESGVGRGVLARRLQFRVQDGLGLSQAQVLEQLMQLFTHRRPPRCDQEVLAGQQAQNHGFHPLQVIKPVLGGLAEGGQHRLAGIVLDQAEQAAQGQGGPTAGALLQPST
jgi:hypothetical protein